MVAVAVRWVWVEEETLGLFYGLFQSLTPQPSVVPCGLHPFFCLASLGFVSLGKTGFLSFPGLGEAAAAILQQLFFQSELYGLVLV